MYYTKEAIQWLELILKDRYSLKFIIEQKNDSLEMTLADHDRVISFDNLQCVFTKSGADFGCEVWRASEEKFDGPIDDNIPAPSMKKLVEPIIEFHDLGAKIHYDILGLTYWMLARVEEVGKCDLDEHQRFSAKSSHAFKYGYLERPIVDEWLNILGQVIQRVWPNIELKEHQFKLKVSHDVDAPSLYGFKPWRKIVRIMLSHLIKRGDLKECLLAFYVKLTTQGSIHLKDPYNTFDRLMDISEANNLKSAFYFICGQTNRSYDGEYELEHPAIRSLLKKIHRRGHEIGLHPSYDTFQKPKLIRDEFNRLKKVCSEEGIIQSWWGGRMHYLRWEQPTTMRALSDARLGYDSTLGYADLPGFRCGSCFDYPGFDPVNQMVLDLRIQPLVVMEDSIISDSYLGLRLGTEAEERFILLRERCRLVGGIFTMLWHNSFLFNHKCYEVYENILRHK